MPPALPALPADLYGEIVAHLSSWDDVPSLKSSSLATRMMRSHGQKLLFESVTLRPELNLLRKERVPGDHDLSGTSADLWRLLARSPHIAGFIRSIHIVDLEPEYAGSEQEGVLVNDIVESDEGKKIKLATWTLPI